MSNAAKVSMEKTHSNNCRENIYQKSLREAMSRADKSAQIMKTNHSNL